MRALLLALSMLVAAPAVAAPDKDVADIQLPKELTDPAMAEKLSRVSVALSRALLSMPVGEVAAAVEGRPATAADKRRTVRDELGLEGADVEKRIAADAKAGGQMMQAGMKAMVAALPAIIKAMEPLAREMEKATANLPDPTYPKR